MKKQSRRGFLEFLGRAGIVIGAGGFLGTLQACNNSTSTTTSATNNLPKKFPLQPIPISLEDKLSLAEGLEYQVIARWGDKISDNDTFGTHCDYLAYLPLDKNNPNDGLLWSNHEYLQPLFVHGNNNADFKTKTKEQIEQEMYSVGGGIVRIRKNPKGDWEIVQNDSYNRRLTGKTMIPFAWHEPILGKKEGMGTFGNCAGGITPWGTVLTCEENYDMFYGETDYTNPAKPKHIPAYAYGWDLFFPQNAPEHYGWVVEVDLKTGNAKKLVAMGRCAHECATCFKASDGRVVVYTGDDCNSEHLYKFISDTPDSLEKGTLYVANTEKGQWISLKYEDQPALQKAFKNQTEVLIRLREAAKLVGATPLDRPEDIEIDPITGAVLITLTNNKPKGNYLGKILKIEEDSADKTGLTFKSSDFMTGGATTGFACPDNLGFDIKGNLWFTSDMSGDAIGKEPYTPFGNNSLFLVPFAGEHKGKVLRIANAPKDAEFTGICFAPDGKTLFLSVQHPGEQSPDLQHFTSHFPDGGNSMPKSSVIAIRGKALDELFAYNG